MYSEDSFFSLGVGGQIGLGCLSFALAVALMFGAWRLMRGKSLMVRLLIAVGLYALFVWLSPQIYYTYYWMIFEDLPVQWVIGWPPFQAMFEHASFTGRSNLSSHGKGVLFWLMMVLALKPSKPRDPTA